MVFLLRKTHLQIKQGLNFDFVNIFNYFCQNELVINLKPGKTESLLFATGRKLSQNKKSLKFECKSQTIVSTAQYKYLGTILDQTLSFSSDLKVMSATALQVCFTCLKESTCETRKNIFYFTSKALLTFQVFKCHDVIKYPSMKPATHFTE